MSEFVADSDASASASGSWVGCHVMVIGTGAVGACLLPGLVGELRTSWHAEVRVCLTRAAQSFVSPCTLTAVAGSPVIPYTWPIDGGPVHVHWADWADATLVWPATLEFLSRCAAGLMSDIPAGIVLSTRSPVLFAPSVPAAVVDRGPFQRTVQQLRDDGHGVIGPVPGRAISNGRITPGGCVSPEQMLTALADRLSEMPFRRSTSPPEPSLSQGDA
jgi:phosphopantothenoylcysteine decarboxylase / phosphopantothenate---cysteine ligase